MLLAEPSASVLSVGLNVGFSAQSNFYEAFREIEGMTPGSVPQAAFNEKRRLNCAFLSGKIIPEANFAPFGSKRRS